MDESFEPRTHHSVPSPSSSVFLDSESEVEEVFHARKPSHVAEDLPEVAAVTKDPRNAEKLCAGGFTEADYNQAYAEWCDLTKYNSDSDSELYAEEYAAAHPDRKYNENPNAAYGLGDVLIFHLSLMWNLIPNSFCVP